MFKLVAFAILASLATTADAYIGPGSGIGLLGSLWAWLVGSLVAISAILLWPLRRMLRRIRQARSARQPQSADTLPGE